MGTRTKSSKNEVLANKASSDKVISNSLQQLTTALGFSQEFGVQLSQTATLTKNNRNYFISNDRITLTFAYTTHGIIQTLIDQPVEDAFRGGITIKSSELDSDNIQDLQNYIKENDVLEEVKDLGKWTRLYGGGGMVINTVGKSNKPLNIEAINEHTPLEFDAVDLWELHKTNTPANGEKKAYVKTGIADPQFFYYGNELDPSRVLLTKGKRAPSFARPQLRGWGMSEVERLIRSLNQYLKNSDLIFELLDEAKIDVFKIKGFNQALGIPDGSGTQKMTARIQMANQVKNYQSAVVMDVDDEYEQKQINFSGLSEMLQQIRLGIANDLKMPLTKIFGQSASGFNSGEDDIENYNSMIESEIRGKFDNLIIQMLKLICQKLFGLVPDDLQIEYKPLRTLSAKEEEEVKTSQFNNLFGMYDRALMTANQLTEEVNQLNLLATDLDEQGEDFPIPAPEKPKLDLSNSKPKLNFINRILNRKNGT
jgi:phage-related protein (TIGR01555 family)